MSTSPVKVPRYPVWPTVLFLTLSALVGVVFGAFVAFAVAEAGLWLGGPVAWFVLFPILLVSFGIILTCLLLITPLWAILGGAWVAATNGGGKGSLARLFGVTLFSHEHPVTLATQAMAQRLGLPPVAFVGWYDAPDINAFAAGTSDRNAMVAFSKGAIETLSKEQLDAIIGHELGHIASNDMARMLYAEGVQGALSFFLVFRKLKRFARWLFTPLSELELLRFSRKREYKADAVGARLTTPQAMIAALEAIRDQQTAPTTRGMAPLMLNARFSADSIFSTHPPLERRIAALRKMASHASQTLERVSP